MKPVSNSHIVFKIHQGTQREDENLCRTCANAHTYTEAWTGNEVIRCLRLPDRSAVLRGPVSKCNIYYDRTKPSLNAMEGIAWEVRTDKKGTTIGFISPEELNKRRRFDDD